MENMHEPACESMIILDSKKLMECITVIEQSTLWIGGVTHINREFEGILEYCTWKYPRLILEGWHVLEHLYKELVEAQAFIVSNQLDKEVPYKALKKYLSTKKYPPYDKIKKMADKGDFEGIEEIVRSLQDRFNPLYENIKFDFECLISHSTYILRKMCKQD